MDAFSGMDRLGEIEQLRRVLGRVFMRIDTEIKIKAISITADEWDLYTTAYRQECQQAAAEINNAIQAAVNVGATRHEVELAALEVMERHARLGARDSEPMWKLGEVLDEIFGRRDR